MKSLTELNTFSAQSVAYDDQGTGAQTLADRYQINGLIDTARPVMENIEKICSAAGSWLSYDINEGKWGVVINTTGTSVASFDDTNILGSITVSGTGINELYNSVKVEFPHRELRDSADFVTIEIPDGDRNANEEDNTLNLTYDTINEPIQAQLLGFIELKQSRVDLAIAFQTDYSKINIKAGDLIDVTNERFGFTDKLFRVISTTEIQDDDGAIRIEINALEYDASVYSTADLYRYTRTDENGIITIGSIGTPGTPQVTKFEIDSRPRIVIETTAPTGVVEGIEYWLTEDVFLPEANRSYKLISIEKPAGGGVFTSGQQITTEYDSITTGDFIIKTRGFNATTTGPFSTPSGIVDFNPKQVTDAIGPNTQSVDATGQILTLLAVNALMGSVDELFKGATTSTGMFSKIFEIFKDVTGVDLVGSASSGSLVVSGNANITIQDEGINLTTTTSLMNFVGEGVEVTNTGPSVQVVVAGSPSGGNANRNRSIGSVVYTSEPSVVADEGPTYGGTSLTILGSYLSGVSNIKFGETTATSYTVSANGQSIVVITPAVAEPGNVPITLTFADGTTLSTVESFNYKYAKLQTVSTLPVANSTTATTSGSYFIKTRTSSVNDLVVSGGGSSFVSTSKTLYGPLVAGTGTAKLYTSAGTLIETLESNDIIINNEVIELPFATRDAGTDYYILIDESLANYCSKYYLGINGTGLLTTPWRFKTEAVATAATFTMTSSASYTSTASVTGTVVSIAPNSGTEVTSSTQIIVSFSVSPSFPISKTGTGNIYIKLAADDSVVAEIPSSTGNIVSSNNTLAFGPLSDYGISNNGQSYYITADSGIVQYNFAGDCYSFNAGTSPAKTSKQTFTMVQDTPFDVVSYSVSPNTSAALVSSNISIEFNYDILEGEENSTIDIYNSGGTLVQSIKADTSYNRDQTLGLLSISGSTLTINPTKNFDPSTTYYVLMTQNSVKDSRGITDPWTGISDVNAIRFTTTSTIS